MKEREETKAAEYREGNTRAAEAKDLEKAEDEEVAEETSQPSQGSSRMPTKDVLEVSGMELGSPEEARSADLESRKFGLLKRFEI